ncbi:MAG: hypothetical protein ACPGPI_11155 [Longimicrobiales bacterium]
MSNQGLKRLIESDMQMAQACQPVCISLMLESTDGTPTDIAAAEALR